MPLPDDLILNAADEVAIRQHLTLVALGKRPADLVIEVGRLLAVYSRQWLNSQEIVIAGRRIAYVGPIGSYKGEVRLRVKYPNLSAVASLASSTSHCVSCASNAPSLGADGCTGVVLRRRLTVTGSTLRPRPIAFKAAIAESLP